MNTFVLSVCQIWPSSPFSRRLIVSQHKASGRKGPRLEEGNQSSSLDKLIRKEIEDFERLEYLFLASSTYTYTVVPRQAPRLLGFKSPLLLRSKALISSWNYYARQFFPTVGDRRHPDAILHPLRLFQAAEGREDLRHLTKSSPSKKKRRPQPTLRTRQSKIRSEKGHSFRPHRGHQE